MAHKKSRSLACFMAVLLLCLSWMPLLSLTLFAAPDPDASGTRIEHCRFDAESRTVVISGTVSNVDTTSYKRLELFALAPDDTLYLSAKSPVASMDISLSFSFTIPVQRVEDIYYRYVLSGTTAGGERVPLTASIYPEIPAAGELTAPDFKGFHTDSTFATTDLCANFEIVDVYLDQLQDTQNGGILYAGSDRYYYFDEAYISALDQRIKNLCGMGCQVYLRFLVSPDVNDLDYADHSETDVGIVNKFITVQNRNGFYAVHAFTDFLTKRYAGNEIGRISGIVLGRQADNSLIYSYSATTELSAYAARYADTLNLISGAGRTNIPDLRVIVPLSDRVGVPTAGDHTPTVFLSALLQALQACCMSPAPFTVMLESTATPDRVTGTANTTAYGTDRLQDFVDFLGQCRTDFPFVDAALFYSWMPDAALSGEELRCAYALQYLALYFNGAVYGFLTDLSLLSDSEIGLIHAALYDLVREIDTDQNAAVLAPVLSALHITSFTEIDPAFLTEELGHRKLVEISATTNGYTGGEGVRGSYRLWDFTVATGVMQWMGSNANTALSVLSDNGSRALTARFDAPAAGEYAEIAYHFHPTANLSYVPFLKLKLGVEGTTLTPYEVQIRLYCGDQTVIAYAMMYAGDTKDLFLNLADYTGGLSKVYSIRILARPLNGNTDAFQLNLHTVDAQSNQLTSEELAALIEADRNRGNNLDAPDDERDYKRPLAITVLVLLFSVMLIVILSLRYRSTQNRREKAKPHDNGEG